MTEMTNMTGLDLFSKLEKVELQAADKFPAEDMEYCRKTESAYQEVYGIYDDIAKRCTEAISKAKNMLGPRYVKDIVDNVEPVHSCNERFIAQICLYFREKYKISIDCPSWSVTRKNEYAREISEPEYEPVPLQYILDSIYEQMGGMSFAEKAFDEVKTAAKEAVLAHKGQSKYLLRGAKLIIESFYFSRKGSIGERYKARVENEHRAFFKALSHFEYGSFDLSQKYLFLCQWEIDEKNGVYDKHDIHSTVISSVKVFKNGKLEIEFKDYQTAVRFMETYFPGIPQQAAA